MTLTSSTEIHQQAKGPKILKCS